MQSIDIASAAAARTPATPATMTIPPGEAANRGPDTQGMPKREPDSSPPEETGVRWMPVGPTPDPRPENLNSSA